MQSVRNSVGEGALRPYQRAVYLLGGPLDALGWLLRELPGGLYAREIVTTGTLTPALPIGPAQRWEHRVSALVAPEPVVLSFR